MKANYLWDTIIDGVVVPRKIYSNEVTANCYTMPKVYEIEELKVGVNYAELKINHGTATVWDDFKTAYYQMKVTYESIKTDVCECHNMIYPLVYGPTLDNKLPYYL